MKKGYKIIMVFLTITLFGTMAAGCSSDTPTKVGEVAPSASAGKSDSVTPEQTPSAKTDQTEFRVGETLMADGLEIVYVSSGEYVSDNQFLQPKEGNKYIYIELACKNTSKSDKNISSFDFDCYADGYSADSFYSGDEALSATMSTGRTTSGKVYFEVPIDATEIEIEYDYNIFSDKKIRFIYEGTQESGYVAEVGAAASEDAYAIGDVIEVSGLKISYLFCEDYESNNMFIQPAEGNKYVSCGFEFENTSNSDELVSSFDFKCYADGRACESTYLRDDDLSTTTLSPGRKAKGTVTFEVPLEASVVEAEYETNAWTSSHIVFTVK